MRTSALLCAILTTLSPGLADAQSDDGPRTREAEEAVAAARAGGTILLCRHALTSRFSEREPIDYSDVASQRRLSPAGEEQSRQIGRALRDQGILIQEVVSSPMDRAIRTAALMVGAPRIDSIWHTNDGNYDGPAREHRRRALSVSVPAGNRLIVSHISTMKSVVPEVDGRVSEGDCVVLRPEGEGHDVIGIVPAQAWSREASGYHRPGPSMAEIIASLASAGQRWRGAPVVEVAPG